MQDIYVPEWRKQNETIRYPFADQATLRNRDGLVVLEGLFLDALLFPIGGGPQLHLSKALVEHERATLWIGDPVNRLLASGTFSLLDLPDQVALADVHGRPAGVLVSEAARLAIVPTWGLGEHLFE